MASFILGYIAQPRVAAGNCRRAEVEDGTFMRTDFRLTKRFTLNIGLRYEYFRRQWRWPTGSRTSIL